MKKARKKRRRKPVHHNHATCHDMRSIENPRDHERVENI
jgi:hypothetical protein